MKMLNICIDIDGTLTDPYYWVKWVNEHFGKGIKKEDVTVYAIHEIIGISASDYQIYYHANKFKIHRNPKLREDAKDYIGRLAPEHNIHYVTARDKDLEMLTYAYLKHHELPMDSLHVTGSPDKVKEARLLDCDVFIEDSLDNAKLLATAGYKVLLMDTRYNRDLEGLTTPLIQRVHSWKDVYEIVSALSVTETAI